MPQRTTGGITGKGGSNVDPLYNFSPSPAIPKPAKSKVSTIDPGFSRSPADIMKANKKPNLSNIKPTPY